MAKKETRAERIARLRQGGVTRSERQRIESIREARAESREQRQERQPRQQPAPRGAQRPGGGLASKAPPAAAPTEPTAQITPGGRGAVRTREERDGYVIETDPRTGITYVTTPDGRRFRLNPDQDVDDFIDEYEEGIERPGAEEKEDEETGNTQEQKDLRAELQDILDMAGMTTPGLVSLIEQSVRENWSAVKFTQEFRKHPDYLANPLFKANLDRAKTGNRFMTEAEIINYATQSRDLARRYGYKEPSADKIAGNIFTGKSLDEFNSQLQVEQRIKQFGGGVAQLWKAYTGDDPTDAELHAVFNKEIDTSDFEKFARRSEMRGRPMVLGLGIRGEAEAIELEQLGITQETAFEGYKRLAEALPAVSRIAAIDKAIADDPTNPFDSFGALFGDIFRSDPKSQEQLMLMMAREQARFRGGGGVAMRGTQAVGLLNPAER